MIRILENLSTKLSFLVNSFQATSRKFVFRSAVSLQEKLLQYQKKRSIDLTCWLCGESFWFHQHRYFCTPCSQDLPRLDTRCLCCALPLTIADTQEDSSLPQYRLCGECISQPPGFFCTVASYRYEFPVKELIRRIKYKKQRYWLKPLSEQLICDIQNAPMYDTARLPDILIPIPMYPKKQKERSFNQALLIAKHISKALNIPVNSRILLKTSHTENQAALNKAERIRNLKTAFSLSGKAQKTTLISGKHIALIDDVMTTKATVQMASKVLIDAGARRIDVWCLARTPKT